MARYQVLQASYINDRIVQAGDVVDYAGEPGTNLRAIEDQPAPIVVEPKAATPRKKAK